MFELEQVTCLKTSPLRVWTALADLEGFARWHPTIQLSGVAFEGSSIDYTMKTFFRPKPMTASATVTRFRKPAEIGWRVGIPGLLMFEEAYQIEALPAGTQMRHATRCWGLLSLLPIPKMRIGLMARMLAADKALERYLRPASPAARPLSRGDRRVAKRKSH